MKPWIKRTLFSFAGIAMAAGAVGGCAHRNGWDKVDSAEFRTKVVERVGSRLELDGAQKQKLTVLAEKLQAQRTTLRGAGGAGEPRSQFRALFAGSKLDQAGANKLVDEKTAAVRTASPELIAAAADFFDNLNPAQQQKVREFMDRGGRRWGRHG
jgi:periplasmic protein CpxP/Spy